jgi:large subunit ribosomal protein L10
MSKPIKEIMMRDYKSRFGESQDALLISIRGLKGTTTTKIRQDLSKKKIKISVVRNSLARKTIEGTGLAKLGDLMSGSSALVYGGQSVVEVAREFVALLEKNPTLELKGAVLDGILFKGKDGVKELSKFPTKDEAIAKAVTLIVSPGRNIMAQIKGPGASIAGIISAIEQKLEKGEEIKKAG